MSIKIRVTLEPRLLLRGVADDEHDGFECVKLVNTTLLDLSPLEGQTTVGLGQVITRTQAQELCEREDWTITIVKNS